MAAGGSATTAYQCTVQAYRLETTPTSRLRTDCATVSDAQERLQRGETVVVAGSDMAQLRQRLASFGVG
jgi:protein involved in polysaccharide export with SLBB domain